MKRVYKNVSVAEMPEGCEIHLDGRPLRTPARAPLVVRSRALAEAIAAEWDAQADEIRPETMPMTQLASTAIDRVRAQRADIVAGVAKYAETDLLCHWAEPHQRTLVERQGRIWQPILDWVALQYDAPLVPGSGVMPKPQSPDACRALRRAVEALDDFTLSGLQAAVAASGSLVLGLALLERRLTAEETYEASQLDETFQIEQWGEDAEAAGRRAALRQDIAAARRFLDLLAPGL
ncbi:ATP12 family chaperone protein [Arenibaculum pallidiluteum]|uniref:ATP12 family chaperone protein n=1 Tax=Arenibaculum pallidiluteum TaxID=2812559 RepID=UPI001A97CE06|nr:ATP12 family protein [Arenibaculum pallidiluteum]